jgi:PIN domain nuclease of toxin-antitoxin system
LTRDLLLDTHALLWWLYDDPLLSAGARGAIASPSHTVHVSAASAWEVATLVRLGRLPVARVLVARWSAELARAGFRALDVTAADALQAGSWPAAHRDPFDRMLAAQAASRQLRLVSRDAALDGFGIERLW